MENNFNGAAPRPPWQVCFTCAMTPEGPACSLPVAQGSLRTSDAEASVRSSISPALPLCMSPALPACLYLLSVSLICGAWVLHSEFLQQLANRKGVGFSSTYDFKT